MLGRPGKKIIPVEFWYSPWHDPIEMFNYNNKLNFVIHEIERITYSHDTASVLKVCLGEGIRYGDFIAILNQLILHQTKRYALLDNDLYIFGEPLESLPSLYLQVDSVCVSVVQHSSNEEQAWNRFREQVLYTLRLMTFLFKHNYILITGFIVLIFIPFTLKIRYRNKQSKSVTDKQIG